jgi:multidrug efflux system membrane fusion protein
LLIETRHDGLTVPATAVQQGPNGAYVWAIGKDQKVQMRPVTVAEISDGQALIDAGLQANESIVVNGQYRLQPGTLVSLLQGDATQAANLRSAVEEALP